MFYRSLLIFGFILISIQPSFALEPEASWVYLTSWGIYFRLNPNLEITPSMFLNTPWYPAAVAYCEGRDKRASEQRDAALAAQRAVELKKIQDKIDADKAEETRLKAVAKAKEEEAAAKKKAALESLVPEYVIFKENRARASLNKIVEVISTYPADSIGIIGPVFADETSWPLKSLLALLILNVDNNNEAATAYLVASGLTVNEIERLVRPGIGNVPNFFALERVSLISLASSIGRGDSAGKNNVISDEEVNTAPLEIAEALYQYFIKISQDEDLHSIAINYEKFAVSSERQLLYNIVEGLSRRPTDGVRILCVLMNNERNLYRRALLAAVILVTDNQHVGALTFLKTRMTEGQISKLTSPETASGSNPKDKIGYIYRKFIQQNI